MFKSFKYIEHVFTVTRRVRHKVNFQWKKSCFECKVFLHLTNWPVTISSELGKKHIDSCISQGH